MPRGKVLSSTGLGALHRPPHPACGAGGQVGAPRKSLGEVARDGWGAGDGWGARDGWGAGDSWGTGWDEKPEAGGQGIVCRV